MAMPFVRTAISELISLLFTRPRKGARPDRDLLALASRLATEIEVERLTALVRDFPAPRTRLHRSRETAMAKAETDVVTAFQNAGLEVRRSAFDRHDVIGYRDHQPFDKIEYAALSGVNIVGLLPGRSREAVVVLAHYDTMRDSPGANDNTASVVGLLELARLLTGLPGRGAFDRTVVLAATDLEEAGMFGAHQLVRELTGEYDVRLAINFESMAYTRTEPGSQRLPRGLELLYPRQVGRIRRREMRADFTALIHNAKAARDAALLSATLRHLSAGPDPILLRDPNELPILGTWLRANVRAARNFRRSDHAAFWDAGLAAVQITDTADHRSAHYHRPTDTYDRLDYDRLREVIAATGAVVAWRAGYRS